MKELEYPFDGAMLLQQRKALRRALLAEKTPRLKKRIAVLGGSTTGDIVKCMELFLLAEGIEPEFYESEYAQYWSDAMFPDERLTAFAPDLVFLCTTNRNVERWPAVTDTKEAVEEKLSAEIARYRGMWESLAEKFHCPVLQNNFEMPFYRLLGNRDAWDHRGRTRFLTRLNDAFAAYAETHENFYLHDLNYVSADYGLSRWSDPAFWNLYKYAMCFDAIPVLAFSVTRISKAIFGKNRKVLALDLDNTLWGGVVGDDGVDGIEIGQETGLAQTYYEFQSYVRALKDIGVLLTVCSKNDEENALAGLKHPEGALSPDDFVLIKANWENKDRNLTETAQQLNLFTDSIVFFDDNPAERGLVRASLPGTAVPEPGDPETYIRTIDRNGYFEVVSLGEDDLHRTEMYRGNALRAAAQASYSDYGAYLDSLKMTAVIDDFLPVYLQRITQLTNKSNQFNLTTKRFTPAEMEAVFHDGAYIRLYGKLVDKFGDNGVVSVVLGKKDGKTLDIELWLMSCRVLKRDMEHAMLDALVARAAAAGIETIRGHYYPTAKNGMVRELFGTLGFTKAEEDADGNALWLLPVAGYVPQNRHIAVHGNETETAN